MTPSESIPLPDDSGHGLFSGTDSSSDSPADNAVPRFLALDVLAPNEHKPYPLELLEGEHGVFDWAETPALEGPRGRTFLFEYPFAADIALPRCVPLNERVRVRPVHIGEDAFPPEMKDPDKIADAWVKGRTILDVTARVLPPSLVEVLRAKAWQEPAPLNDRSKLPDFPTEYLPPDWREIVDEVAVGTQTPNSLGALMSISTLGACYAGKVEVVVRRDYTEQVNPYTVSVLESGNRKSAVRRLMCRPLELREREDVQRANDKIVEAKKKRKRLETVLRKAEEASKKKPTKGRRNRVTTLSAALDAYRLPPVPVYLVDDVTPERMAALLAEHGGRMAALSAEGTIFKLMARYGQNGTPNLDVYLCGWTGDPLRVSRGSKPDLCVPEPNITLGISTQPGVLAGLAERKEYRGEGLLPRFLYARPQSLLGHRDIEPEEVSQEAIERWSALVNKAFDLPFAEDAKGRACRPHPLKLSADAKKYFSNFRRSLEPKLAPGAELGELADWGGKAPGQVLRLAATIHLVRERNSPAPWAVDISGDTMIAALGMMEEFFIPHAIATFLEMGADPDLEKAQHILTLILKNRWSHFSRSDLIGSTRMKKGYRAKELYGPLNLLVEAKYLAYVPPPTDATREMGSYDVNPIWFRRASREGAR